MEALSDRSRRDKEQGRRNGSGPRHVKSAVGYVYLDYGDTARTVCARAGERSWDDRRDS